MPLLGLAGYPLTHSFSPEFFRKKFLALGLKDWEYHLFPLPDIHEFPSLVENQADLAGLNITIPHKQAVLAYCDELSNEVKSIGAANLIQIIRTSKGKPHLKAFNTDFYGFSHSLKTWYINNSGKALILGSGGSSKAVQYSLKQMEIDFDVAGRNLPLNYTNIDLGNYALIINCTPVGMKKEGTDYKNETLPLPFEQIQASHYFYDLVYNPGTTAMMRLFSDAGAKVKNGLDMLHLQAEKTWEIIYGN